MFAHNTATLMEAVAHGLKTAPPGLRATSMVLPGIVAAAIVRNESSCGARAYEPKYPSEPTKGTMQMARFLP